MIYYYRIIESTVTATITVSMDALCFRVTVTKRNYSDNMSLFFEVSILGNPSIFVISFEVQQSNRIGSSGRAEWSERQM
jgi:hypothetical protein